jgi:hypothetical protein
MVGVGEGVKVGSPGARVGVAVGVKVGSLGASVAVGVGVIVGVGCPGASTVKFNAFERLSAATP